MLYELNHYEAMTLQDACVAAQCRAEENAEAAERCANNPNMPEAERAAFVRGLHSFCRLLEERLRESKAI